MAHDVSEMRWVAAINEMSTGERISWVCLHVLVAGVPLAVSNFTWLPGVELPFTYDMSELPKLFLLRVFTLVALAGWIWHLRSSDAPLRTTRYRLILLGLAFWFALTTAVSVHWPTSLLGFYTRHDGALAFLNYLVVWFLAVQLLDRMSRVRSLARTLVIAGALISVYGLLQFVGADPIDWGLLPSEAGRAFSTFSNPVLLGGYLLFPLLIAPALALSEKSSGWRAAYWAAFILVAGCWVAALTRSAWLGGMLALAALAWGAYRRRIRLTTLDRSFMGGSLAVLALVVASTLSSASTTLNVWERLTSAADIGSGSTASRLFTWGAALRAIQDRPITGFGPDTFGLIFPQYKTLEMVQAIGSGSIADNAHNYLLQLAVTIGIPGAVALLGFFVAALVASFGLAFPRSDDGSAQSSTLVLAGFWAASAAYLVHLMFALSVPGSTVLLWLSLAALVAPAARAVEIRLPAPVAWVSLLVLVATVGLALASARPVLADNRYAQTLSAGQSYEIRLRLAQDAVRLNPLNYVYRVGVGEVHWDAFVSYQTQADELAASGADSGPARDAARQAFIAAERALVDANGFVGWDYPTQLLLVKLYNMGGATISPDYYRKAGALARESLRLAPIAPDMAVQYALALSGTGDNDEAERQLLSAANMDPRLPRPHVLLGDLYRGLGRPEAARTHYLDALALDPNDESVRSALESLGQAGSQSE